MLELRCEKLQITGEDKHALEHQLLTGKAGFTEYLTLSNPVFIQSYTEIVIYISPRKIDNFSPFNSE